MHESCGKCTPCRVGTRWLVQILRAVEDGTATENDLELLLDVCDRIIGKCLCVLGDSAAMPVASCVTKFRDEFHEHLEHGGCPFGEDSSLAHLFASDRPARAYGGARRGLPREHGARPRHGRREGRAHPQGHGSRRDRARRRRRDPGLLLRAAARCADRRLPHVPRRDRGHAEAAGRLHADRAGRHGRPHRAHVGEGGRGAERDARVHPRQPPARLPRLRQGRRVPAARTSPSATARARRG